MIDKVKICTICGITSNEIDHMVGKNNKFNKELCNKHYRQLCREGEITNPKRPSTRKKHEINDYIYHNDYVEVSLHNFDGEEVSRTKINLEDVETCKKYTWRLKDNGYAVTTYERTTKYLHRIILNPPEDKCIDHINRNKLDNRRENLRVCTQSENSINTLISTKNTSGHKGVSWSKSENKWYARLRVNCKNIYLGYYTNIEDAIEARKKAEEKYFGEFAPKEYT